MKQLLVLVFSVCLLGVSVTKSMAQDVEKESVETAFRNGRSLSGFSGSISSVSTKNTSADNKTISNRYRIEVSSGKFIKDRFNLRFNINLERENIEDDGVRTSEDFFIGPKRTCYFSKSKIGSMFVSLTPGFIIYRDKRITSQS